MAGPFQPGGGAATHELDPPQTAASGGASGVGWASTEPSVPASAIPPLPVQVWVDVSQVGVEPLHCELSTQTTHVFVDVSHAGVAPLQSALVVHCGCVQVWSAQTRPAAQVRI